jgi:hypothetical protein
MTPRKRTPQHKRESKSGDRKSPPAVKLGDPFATKTLLDRAKLYLFGVRDYSLGVVEREREEYEAAHMMASTPVVLRANDDCPECKTVGSMREIAGAGTRCSQCGWQPKILNPPGSPNRTQLESWTDYSQEHKEKFEAGFSQAVSRFGGRK